MFISTEKKTERVHTALEDVHPRFLSRGRSLDVLVGRSASTGMESSLETSAVVSKMKLLFKDSSSQARVVKEES